MKTLFIVILYVLVFNAFAENNNDSTNYRFYKLVPKVALHVQKGYGIEAGIFLNRFQVKYKTEPYTYYEFISSGFYLSSEVILRNISLETIIGPKIGWETSVFATNFTGSFLGAEYIHYTSLNTSKYNPSIMLKLGIPLLFVNIHYGYTIFIGTDLKNDIGKHRLAITYTINKKARKIYNAKLRQMYSSSKLHFKGY
jgi:hypothetical protein